MCRLDGSRSCPPSYGAGTASLNRFTHFSPAWPWEALGPVLILPFSLPYSLPLAPPLTLTMHLPSSGAFSSHTDHIWTLKKGAQQAT